MGKWVQGVLIFLGAVIFSGASIILSMGAYEALLLNIVTYAVYCLAMVFLTAAVWRTVCFFREANPKKRLERAVRRTRVTARMYDDMAYRTMVSGHLSMFGNLFFGLAKAAAGWYYSSSWLCVLALYYLALCAAKGMILRGSRRIGMGMTGEERVKGEQTEGSLMRDERAKLGQMRDEHAKVGQMEDGRTKAGQLNAERLMAEWWIYRLCGILLLVLTVTLQGVIILIVEQGKAFVYEGTLIFVVALYDFYCLISSIVYMVRTRKRHTPVVVSIKTIRFATSLAAMLTLQTAMFASFGNELEMEKQQMMNIMTGTGICGILILWGILMIRRSQKELRRRD